ncbi:MAG: hypothetical protein ACLTK0_08215 [Anaerovoracaceae bacterium]
MKLTGSGKIKRNSVQEPHSTKKAKRKRGLRKILL